MPRAALVLGYAGLLPVVAAIVLLLSAPRGLYGPSQRAGAIEGALFGYAALILSFLGGMWWGQASRTRQAAWVYVAAVAPTLLIVLLITVAALLRVQSTLPLMLPIGAAILATLPIDHLLTRRGVAPAWWMRLRVPLSLGLGLGTMLVGVLAER